MWALSLLFLFICGRSWSCPCNGVLIPGSDQVHCWEVISVAEGGWVSADVACQAIGGHLGHLNTNLTALKPYLQKIYTKPILTGIVVGNSETDRYAMVCPNNVFYALLNATTASIIFAQNATSANCGFVTNTDYKVHFAPCSTPADALCDRPVQKMDYCDIQMNCTSTTTTVTSNSSSTTTSSTSRSSTSSSIRTSTTTITPVIVPNMTTTILITSSTSPSTTTTTTTKPSSTSSSTTTKPSSTSSSTSTSTSRSSTTTAIPSVASSSTPSVSNGSMTSTPSVSFASTPINNNKPTDSPTCPVVEDCAWKIFGACSSWFPWLLLGLLLLSLLFCLCCCCFFRSREKKTEKLNGQSEEYAINNGDIAQGGYRQRRIIAPIPSTASERSIVSYSPEPGMFPNPPVAVESTPVIMIPMKMSPPPPRTEIIEKLTKEFTKEIHVLEKEKVVVREIGVNTDPWTPTLEVQPPKRKKDPPTPIEIQDDLDDDISIKIPESPVMDDDDEDDKYNFIRNPKPENFDDMPIGDVPMGDDPRGGGNGSRNPATVINLTADPRNIRSPPIKQRNVHLPTEDNVKSFSPISNTFDVDGNGNGGGPGGPPLQPGRKHHFPSPPPHRHKIPEVIPERWLSQNQISKQWKSQNNEKPSSEPRSRNSSNNVPKPERGANSTPDVSRGNGRDRGPAGGLEVPNGNSNRAGRSPTRNSNGNENPGHLPAMSDYNSGNRNNNRLPGSESPTPLIKQADVSIRAANGRLGGVVRVGGGPEDQAPQGWKPWAKTSRGF